MSDDEYRGLFESENASEYLNEEPEASLESLTDSVHRVTIGKQSNLLLEGNDGLIAVDTFGTPGRARVFRRTTKQHFEDKSIESIVYSHDHVDSTGFSAVLAEDAEILADETTARIVDERDLPSQLPPDTLLQSQTEEIKRYGLTLRLINPGPTHGTGNRALFFPDNSLLFMADTILPDARYALFPDYHLGNFVRNVRSLLELGFERFVPARGPTIAKDLFAEGCDYVDAVMTCAQEAFAEGLPIWERETIEDYTKEELAEDYGHLDGFENHVGLSALRAAHHYLMGGWGLEDTPEASYNLL